MSQQNRVRHWGEVDPYRWELTDKIASVLKANGTNLRPVSYATELPEGGINQLLFERPFDAVRAEMGGTTVTIQITTERHGEQPSADQVVFACYDFVTFRDWFYGLLRRSGQTPRPSEPVDFMEARSTRNDTRTVRPALSPIRHTKKRNR